MLIKKMLSANRREHVHVSVHFGNNPGQPAAAVRDAGHHDCGRGHDGGIRNGHVLAVSDNIRHHVRSERGQLPDTVRGTGTTHVAQGQGPYHRSGRGG